MPTAPQPSTIKTSLGDYPSLTLWKADIPANTTGLGEFRAINYIAGLVEGAGVAFSGFTTTAADPIVLDGSGLTFTGVAGGGAWVDSGAGGSGTLIRMTDNLNFFNLYKMELRGRNGQTALHFCLNCGAGSLYKIDSSLIHSDDQLPINAFAANGNYEFTNTAFYAGNPSRVIDIRGVASCKLYYDTFWAPACDFTVLGDSVCTIKDSVAGGATNHCIWATFGILGTYCATTDADATTINPGTGGVNNVVGASVFINVTVGAENFKLKSGTNALVDAGNAISGITVDAIGTTRPQGSAPDIGFNERLGGTAYNESVSESGSAAETVSGAATLPSVISDGLTATNAQTSQGVLPSVASDGLAAVEVVSSQAVLPSAIVETANASDSPSAPSGASVVTDTLSATDQYSATVNSNNSIVENISAVDTYSSILNAASSVNESLAAFDAYLSAAIMAAAVADALTPTDIYTTTATVIKVGKCASLKVGCKSKADGDWNLNFGGILNLEFDFTDALADGESVSMFSDWAISVAAGVDPSFVLRLTGPTNYAANKTQHQFTAPDVGLLPITYVLSTKATTTFGEVIPGWAFMVVTPIGGCVPVEDCPC